MQLWNRWPSAIYCFNSYLLLLLFKIRLTQYRTHGDELRACIASLPHIFCCRSSAKGISGWRITVARKLVFFEVVSISPDDQSPSAYNKNYRMLFNCRTKLSKTTVADLMFKTWIYACIGITDSKKRTVYKQTHFSSFTKGLNEPCIWLAKYNCNDICMESTEKYWIPAFNILEKHIIWITLSHSKYTKPMRGNKTDRKDAK